jgi:succinoglycan biosynthesis transport protein ExoP
VASAHVVAVASTPLSKTYPKTKLVMLLAVLVGAMAGTAIAYLRHVLDRTLRKPKQVRDELGLAYLGSLPRLRTPRWSPQSSTAKKTLEASQSEFTAALQWVKVTLDVESRTHRIRSIGMVSLHSGEGATTFCAGLGALFAQSGANVLMMDADFRRRTLSRQTAGNAQMGLLDLLHQWNDRAIFVDPNTKASVLPLVGHEAPESSVDILGSQPMRELLGRLASTYEFILVDLPALDQGVETRAIGPFLDGCILIVQWGRTTLDELKDAITVLQAGQVVLFGVVINQVEEGVPPLLGITLADLKSIHWGSYVELFTVRPLSR